MSRDISKSLRLTCYMVFLCAESWRGVSTRDNVARNGRASQSSTNYYGNNYDFQWNADLAIDGEKSERLNLDDKPTCSGTSNQRNPWWQVDLHKNYYIEEIRVYGRLGYTTTEQLRGFKLYLALTNSPRYEVFNDQSTKYEYQQKNATYIIPMNRQGRYVRIALQGYNHLIICEVEVYGCPSYFYGPHCSEQCGQCKDGEPCRSSDGICPYGCMAGFKPEFCKHECDAGWYGENCTSDCGHCKRGSACNRTNGYCASCAVGYKGPRCKDECPSGTFGDGCSLRCHCKNHSSCDNVNGSCPDGQCDFGWSGVSCNKDLNLIQRLGPSSLTTSMSGDIYQEMNSSLAIDGNDSPEVDTCECCSVTHGSNPWWKLDLKNIFPIRHVIFIGRSGKNGDSQFKEFRLYFSNKSNDFSEPFFQHTEGDPKYKIDIEVPNILTQYIKIDRIGYILTICEVKVYEGECLIGRFGDVCQEECHCADRLSCDRKSGLCGNAVCEPGWKGDACNKACDLGTYGSNCTGVCHCKDNDQCHKVNGTCGSVGCAVGWRGSTCSEACESGTYGINCSSSCHCRNSVDCDHVTGYCTEGLCEAGYLGNNCSVVCDQGLFGISCSNECHCQPNISCNHVDGVCENGVCAIGFRGDNCSIQIQQRLSKKDLTSKSTSTIQGVLIGLAVVLIIGFGILAIALIRKKLYVRDSLSKRHAESSSNTKQLASDTELKRGLKENCIAEDTSETKVVDTVNYDTEYYNVLPRNTDLHIYKIWDYINDNRFKSKEYFEKEYQSLPKGLLYPCETAQLAENYKKNRYKDIYAYDQNRVVLLERDENGSDYFNASYINGYEKVKKFIAAQGPTEKTVNDFWKMIWQEDVQTIVMLTNLKEGRITKCIQYWPDNDKMSYGNLTVLVKDTVSFKDYLLRTVLLEKNVHDRFVFGRKHNTFHTTDAFKDHRKQQQQNVLQNDRREEEISAEESRMIKQFHFKAWPDKSVPDTAWPTVQFWRAVTEEVAKDAKPILVHCSAGIGRTGTFIALDNLYHQAQTEGCLQPLKMVETLRRQRVNMVQTQEQYIFLHEAVAESLYFGTDCIFLNSYEDHLKYMRGPDPSTGKSRLYMQYELLGKSIQYRSKTTDVAEGAIYANSSEEAIRESTQHISGFFHNEDLLEITTFSGTKSVLLYQIPTDDDQKNYLRIIREENVKTVITIAAAPDALQKYSKLPDGVKEFMYTYDVDTSDLKSLEAFKKCLEDVQNWQTSLSDSQPILIQTRANLSNCMIFSIILGETKRMKLDGAVNLLAAVKMALKKHATLMPTFKQYEFCHEVILHLIKYPDEVYANV